MNETRYGLILITITVVALLHLGLGYEIKSKCIIPSSGVSAGSLCSVDGQSSKSLFILRDCKAAPQNGTQTHVECFAELTKLESCNIELEISNMITHKPFSGASRCKGYINMSISLKSITNPPIDEFRLFSDSSSMRVNSVVLEGSNIDSGPLKNLLQTNFPKIKSIKITGLTTNKSIISRCFDSNSLTELESIQIKDSSLNGLSHQGFYVGPRMKLLELVNVDFNEGSIEKRSIDIYRACDLTNAPLLSITLRNCRLRGSAIKEDLISVESTCTKSLRLNISLTGNRFEHVIPESAFGKLLTTAFSNQGEILDFQFDPIDCCLSSNFWLFDLIASQPANDSFIKIDCSDLNTPVRDYKNRTDLTQTCDRRNVYPILAIAIVAILLLASLLGLFSCVCLFYVLPRRGNIIMINMPGKRRANYESGASHKSAPDSFQIKTLNTDSTAKPGADKLNQPTIRYQLRSDQQNRPQKQTQTPRQALKSPRLTKSSSNPMAKAHKGDLKLPMTQVKLPRYRNPQRKKRPRPTKESKDLLDVKRARQEAEHEQGPSTQLESRVKSTPAPSPSHPPSLSPSFSPSPTATLSPVTSDPRTSAAQRAASSREKIPSVEETPQKAHESLASKANLGKEKETGKSDRLSLALKTINVEY